MNTTTSTKRLLARGLAAIASALLALTVFVPRGFAIDVYWGGGTGALTDNNWFSDPGLTTPVIRANGDVINLASGTVFIAGTGTVYDTNIGLGSGDNAAVIVSGTWNNTNGELSIGNAAGSSGALIIQTGGTVRANTFYVGNAGSGYLHIAEGGALFNNANAMLGRNAGGSGTAVIDGSWTANTYIQVGYIKDSQGNVISIGQTGSVKTVTYMRIGGDINASGTVIVHGLLDIGTNLAVGYTAGAALTDIAARGSLYIHESGTVLAGAETGLGYLGKGSSSTEVVSAYGEATIDGVLKVNDVFSVGRSGDGFLTLNSTGTIINTTGFVARYYNSQPNHGHATGTAIINGSWINSADFYVASAGRGALFVNEGGIVTVAGTTVIANAATGSGTAVVGGKLEGAGILVVGNAGDGYLAVTPTGTVTAGSNVLIGGTVGGSGSLSVGGYFRSGGYLYMNYGTTVFDIASTGTMELNAALRMGNIAGSVASGTVAGLLSLKGADYNVGYAGRGSLVVTESGSMIIRGGANNDYFILARSAGGYGEATIRGLLDTGTRNHVSNANTYVGHTGTGVMNVESTGTVIASGTGGSTMVLLVGNGANATGTLNVAGRFDVRGGQMLLAETGTAYLNIASGGSVLVSGSASLGKNTNARGEANVSGLWQIGENLGIANSGTGILNIESGGSVIVGGTTIVAAAATASGTLALNGGVLETRQLALGEGAATVVVNGGTLRAAADASDFLNMASLALGAGTLNLDTQAFAVTATNAFAGSSGAVLNKFGAGALTLTADSSAYAGTTNIRAGSLVGNAAAKIGGQLNILNGATLDLRNGPLAAANVTFADGATWFYSLTGKNELGATGALAFDGGGTLLLDRGILEYGDIPGAYTLATYATITGTGNLASWFVTGVDFATQSTFNTTSTPGSLILEIGYAGLDFLYWQGGAGTWDAATASWIRSGTAALWNSGALGIFNAGAGAVDVSGVQTFSGLQFDSDGYVLGGTGTLAAGGTANINVTTAGVAATINTALAADALRKAGPGAVTLGGVATIGGIVAVDSGSLSVAPAGVLSASEIQVSSTVSTPATLAVAGVLNNTGTLLVGSTGSGALIVESGGTATSTREIQIGSHGSGTARIAGYLGTSGTAYIGVDAGGQGVLDIASTGTVKVGNSGYIGNLAGATGTAFVAGLLDITTNLAVGQGGAGVLDIASTGAVRVGGGSYIANQAGSSGTLVVAGTLGTSMLSIGAALGTEAALRILTGGTVSADTFYVGNYGSGYLYIAEGGALSNSANAMLGRNTGGSGTAVIDGSWTAATYIQMGYIADSRDNVVTIGQTGTVKTTTYFRVGSAAGSSGTLTIGGLLDVGTNLTMGTSGSGTLDLQSSGSITVTGSTFLGNEAGSYGEATIGGYLSTSVLNVGYTGAGVLDLVSGGTIISNTVNIGAMAAGSGTLLLNGGVLETRQLVQGAGAAAFVFNGGTLRAGAASADFLNMASLDLGAGALTLDTQAFAVTATNAFAGTGAAVLDKTGAGALKLTADSSAYAGTLNIRSGGLAGGAAAKIGGQVNILSGATLDMRSGPLATGNISLADGAVWKYSIAGQHALDVSGTLVFEGAGTFLLDRDGTPIPDIIGAYTLATYTDISGTANLASWLVAGMDFTLSSTLTATVAPGSLILEIGSADVDFLYWQGGNGAWDNASTTWLRSGSASAWNSGAFAVFNAGAGSVTISDAQTITGLQFDTADYILEGTGSLTSGGTVTIHTTAPTAAATINVPITAMSLHKAGAGSVTLGGPASFTGEAIIDGGSLAIAATGNLSASGVQISSTVGDAAAVAVAGLLSNTGTLFIGSSGSGALAIAATGTVNSASTVIASDAASIGSATVAGLLNTTVALVVGKAGAGVLDIAATGTATGASAVIASDAASTGSANVAGLLNVTGEVMVAMGGAGALGIASTGTVNATSAAIGAQAGSTGSATVAGLLKTTGGINVGDAGNGSLDIASTGTVTAGAITHIGAAAGSSGTARVAGLLGVTGSFSVGNNGTGHLEVTSSGTVSNAGTSYVGYAAGSTGTATVAGLLSASGNLAVGQAGEGYLEIAPTGTVSIIGNSYVGNIAGSSGTLNVAGLFSGSGNLSVGHNGTGALIIAPTGTVTNATTALGWNAGGTGYADVAGVWNVRNNLNVGNAAGAFGELKIAPTGTVTVGTYFIVANVPDATGTASIAGSLVVSSSVVVGNTGGVGYIEVAPTGTITSGNITLGSGTGAQGIANVAGFWNAAGGNSWIGDSGTGTLVIGQTGTVFLGGVDNYVLIGGNASSSGDVTVAGYLDTGTRSYVNPSSGGGALIVGNGVLTITPTGTVTTSGTGQDTFAFAVSRSGATSSVFNLAGLLETRAGGALIGTRGVATVNIASTGTFLVDGEYRQTAQAALSIAVDPARTDAYITAASARLSGTLTLAGSGLDYTPVARSSELSDAGVLVLTATSGTIAGSFSAITGMGGVAPDYLMPGSFIETDESTGFANYRAAYRLAWNGPDSAHGTFTIAGGETFEVDTPLADRIGEAAPGWDKKSLTKSGAGTLILSAQNTFTGTLAINSGTIRLGGPELHRFGSLANDGVLDFGTPATLPVTPPGIMAAPPSGITYRTVEVGSLSGNGIFQMTVNPGTGESDRLIVLGKATGSHHINLTASADATAPDGGSAPTLAKINGTNGATFTGGLDFDGANYAIVPASGGNIILATNGEAGINDAIRGVPGAQSLMWFASQDNLARRIGELRGVDTDRSSLWLRVRAEESRIRTGANPRPFTMHLYGAEIGVDKTFHRFASSRVVTGIYGGYGRATQDFRLREGIGSADGKSSQLSLGLYAAWLHNAGWYSNLTLAGARHRNEFGSADQSGNRTRGNYDDHALGASLEAGKRIALDRVIGKGWFAEPSAQVSVLRLMRKNYATTGANLLEVRGDGANVIRTRGVLRAGRAWQAKSGQIEVSARAGASNEASKDGEIRMSTGSWRPNIDGTRAEAGLGLIWRRTLADQLYFDYEFATGDSYQKPWSVSLGYRHAF